MDPKYHYEWALKNTPPAYAQFRDIAGDNSFRDVQFRLPRFHSSIVTDLATFVLTAVTNIKSTRTSLNPELDVGGFNRYTPERRRQNSALKRHCL